MRALIETLIEKVEEIKGCACEGLSCGECQYTANCFEGEQSAKVAVDKVINLLKPLLVDEGVVKRELEIRNIAINDFAKNLKKELSFDSGYPVCDESDYIYEQAFCDARSKVDEVAEKFKNALQNVEQTGVGESNVCEWQEDVYGRWHTSCHVLADNTPLEYTYCPYCSKKIKAVSVGKN